MPAQRFLSRLPLLLALAVAALLASATLPTAQAEGALDSPAAAPAPPAPPAPSHASCPRGKAEVDQVMPGENWAPITPSKWQFPGDEVILAEAGTAPPGPRRPFEFAVLTEGPEFGSVQIDAEVRLDTPVSVSNRDVIIVFGYQSPTKFYYAHFSSDNTIYPHNGIFLVNDADRLRLDHQWNGSTGAPPAISDAEYHKVRVRHCSATGEIAVFVDGAKTPLMTATDTTLKAGRTGFGSFDNIGRARQFRVTGTPGCRGAEATVTGTERPDRLKGTNHDDVIAALGGNDRVDAKGGNDVVCAGDGDDDLRGGPGDDVLLGEAGLDRFDGGPGTNVTQQD